MSVPSSDPSLETAAFCRLLQRFAPGSRFTHAWPLPGGVSAEVTALAYVSADGRQHTAVVRRHGAADLTADPQIAVHEFQLLRTLHTAGLPTPAPLFVDDTCDLFATPVLVTAFVEGAIEFDPPDLDAYLCQMAGFLAQLHNLDISHMALDSLRLLDWSLGPAPAQLDDALSEGKIRQALRTHSPPQAADKTVLLHGDFWPGNVLWRDGQLAAVIDWEDAALGDALADLGNARLEILWAFGPVAMHRFTDTYQKLTGQDLAPLPYWDLRAALRPAGKLATWGLDPHVVAKMRERHRHFVQQALGALNANQ